MREIEVTKRGWVKNAAIVFLAVMLVLTFFSNDILNRSLPEVAAQYTQNLTINSRIRGSGTVTANELYEVIAPQVYTIGEVRKKTGEYTEIGETLIVFSQSGSEELKAAQEELYAAELDMEKFILLDSPDNDFTEAAISVQNARLALEDAKEAYEKALQALAAAEQSPVQAQAELAAAQERLEAISFDEAAYLKVQNDIIEAQNTISTGATELEIAKRNLELFIQTYDDTRNMTAQEEYKKLEERYKKAETALSNTSREIEDIELEIAMLMQSNYDPSDPADPVTIKIADRRAELAKERARIPVRTRDMEDAKAALDAYIEAFAPEKQAEYKELNSKVTAAEIALKEAENALSRLEISASALTLGKDRRDAAMAEVEAAEQKLDGINNEIETLESAVRRAGRDVTDAEQGLTRANKNLSDLQKSARRTDTMFDINMREKNKKIDELRGRIKELETEGSSGEIKAAVAGKITQVNAIPGRTTDPSTPLMIIEVTDRGYSLTIPVTSEQSSRVRVGDNAEVDRGWWSWGEPLSAVLTSIRPDTQNPATGRLLVFAVSGADIESGTQLNVTIAQRSENYGIVVPNSAIRSDTNGDFVLIVETRSSPLRNRYIATRVDVTILASDDINTAISGAGLTGWDFVITTSTRPIEPGMQVRMVDNP